MCNQQFLNEWENAIRPALVAKMLENLDWFNQEYKWPMHEGDNRIDTANEYVTIKTFAEFSFCLREAKKALPDAFARDMLQHSIYKILEWGGIRKKPVQRFTDLIERNQLGIDNAIASWSKILAALKPGRHFIYDSRVAIALASFSMKITRDDFECRFWDIPQSSEDSRKDKLERIFPEEGVNEETKNRNNNIINILLAEYKKFKNDQHSDTWPSDNIGQFLQNTQWHFEKQTINDICEIFTQTPFERFSREYKNNRPRGTEKPIPICYSCYHDLLRTLEKEERIKNAYRTSKNNPQTKTIWNAYEKAGFTPNQAIMAHIEKMLFMMKEPILALYNKPTPPKTERKML